MVPLSLQATDEPASVRCCIKHARSLSCPDLTESVANSPSLPRKRAKSENYNGAVNLAAVDDHFIENSSDVLSRVVLALSTFENASADDAIVNDPDDGGIDLFSDDEILEDEKVPKRNRAKSVFFYKAQMFKREPLTWSGDNTHIQQFINDQYREEKVQADNAEPKSVRINVDDKDIKPEPNRRQSIFQTFSNMFNRRNTVVLDRTLEEDPVPIKMPISPLVKHRDIDQLRRPSESTLNSVSSENILENTTIADLIRAIETAHICDANESTTTASIQSTRRASLAPSKRDASAVFAPKIAFRNLTPPPIAKSSRLAPIYARRASFVPTDTNQNATRQSSIAAATIRRNQFEISKVDASGPQLHMRRRFSAFPMQNTSIQNSPLVQRRANVKRPMSPLALSHPSQSNDVTPPMQKQANVFRQLSQNDL